ncbi:MAG: type II toxin-antitoxin system prevent-host-death family antitoxin [Rickettsiales bacterium]|nr:type II toxin-antitoxin system prevent-host-death family antitoxin [Rickettsiales bacterium]
MSITISYSEARKHLKLYLDKACLDSEPVIITRKNGTNAVIVSEDEFNSLDETKYLLLSPKNRKALDENMTSDLETTFNSISGLKDENNL